MNELRLWQKYYSFARDRGNTQLHYFSQININSLCSFDPTEYIRFTML